MRIRKFKLKDNKTHVTYEQPNKQGEYDEFSMTCADKPGAS